MNYVSVSSRWDGCINTMADHKDESLACVGYAIYKLLDHLAISRSKLPDHFEAFQTLDLIINEGYRFKIWSKSTGLLIPGHGSLDYRVREAESLSTILCSFLTDLQENFEEGELSWKKVQRVIF